MFLQVLTTKNSQAWYAHYILVDKQVQTTFCFKNIAIFEIFQIEISMFYKQQNLTLQEARPLPIASHKVIFKYRSNRVETSNNEEGANEILENKNKTYLFITEEKMYYMFQDEAWNCLQLFVVPSLIQIINKKCSVIITRNYFQMVKVGTFFNIIDKRFQKEIWRLNLNRSLYEFLFCIFQVAHFQVIQQLMFQKWSHKEDAELKKLVLLYSADWHKIQQLFSTKRSRNALIKRWHTKLKNFGQSTINTSQKEDLYISEKSPTTQNSLVINSNLSISLIKNQNNSKSLPSRQWTQLDDLMMKYLVLDLHFYDWDVLAQRLQVTQEEAKQYWGMKIYPIIKSNKKIAGAVMWTKQEDKLILHAVQKAGYKWQNLLDFLPERSYFSLQARWKRIFSDWQLQKKKNLQKKIVDIRAMNHYRRLKQYRNILKLRKRVQQRLNEHNSRQESILAID